jgi:hypothetical protein
VQARTTLEALAFARDEAPKHAQAQRLARLLGHLGDDRPGFPGSASAFAGGPWAACLAGGSAAAAVPGGSLLRAPLSPFHQGSAWANAAQQLGGPPWRCLLPLWPLDAATRCLASRHNGAHYVGGGGTASAGAAPPQPTQPPPSRRLLSGSVGTQRTAPAKKRAPPGTITEEVWAEVV